MTSAVATTHFAARLQSPLGDLFAVVDQDGALVLLDFVGASERAESRADLERRFEQAGGAIDWDRSRLAHVAAALARYFGGQASTFDLALAPVGTTFQKKVWRELVRIPYGSTISYGELARRVGRPGAARAVGRANATNPIALVVPCHRVIGSNGTLTGYAGGIERKRDLLALEGALEEKADA